MGVAYGAGGDVEGIDYQHLHLWRRWMKYRAWYGKWRGLNFSKIRRDQARFFNVPVELSSMPLHNARKSPIDYLTQAYLYHLIRSHKPKTIIELGVERGCSTYAFLQAIHDNGKGHLHSFDIIPKLWPWDYTRRKLAPVCPPRLKGRKWWTYHEGNTLHTLPKVLDELGEIDIFYHDADHTFKGQLSELQLAWSHGAKVLLVDYANYYPYNVDFFEYPKHLQPQPSRVMDGVIFR